MTSYSEISSPCPVGWSSGFKDLDGLKQHWPHVVFKIGNYVLLPSIFPPKSKQ